VAEEPAPLDRRVVGRVDPLLHVAARLGERLAHLARHEVGDLLLALAQEVADAAEHVAARRGRRAPPHVEAAGGARHGGVDVGGARLGKAADEVAGVGRVAVLEVGAGRRGDPPAGDEVLEVGHECG
jgi:hypothetical protein